MQDYNAIQDHSEPQAWIVCVKTDKIHGKTQVISLYGAMFAEEGNALRAVRDGFPTTSQIEVIGQMPHSTIVRHSLRLGEVRLLSTLRAAHGRGRLTTSRDLDIQVSQVL